MRKNSVGKIVIGKNEFALQSQLHYKWIWLNHPKKHIHCNLNGKKFCSLYKMQKVYTNSELGTSTISFFICCWRTRWCYCFFFLLIFTCVTVCCVVDRLKFMMLSGSRLSNVSAAAAAAFVMHQWDDIFHCDSTVNRSIENRSCNLFSSFLYKMYFFSTLLCILIFSRSNAFGNPFVLLPTRHRAGYKNVQPYMWCAQCSSMLVHVSHALGNICSRAFRFLFFRLLSSRWQMRSGNSFFLTHFFRILVLRKNVTRWNAEWEREKLHAKSRRKKMESTTIFFEEPAAL